MFTLHDNYFTDLDKFISVITTEKLHRCYQWRKNGGYHVIDVPVAFDIETSSFYIAETKQVIMYIWQFAFNGYVIVGRTWEDFLKLLDRLAIELNIDMDNRLYIYVHNLSYEFQFIRKWLKWDSVFAVDERKPIKALTVDGYEFRDSYILSGYSLEKTGEQLQKYKVQKLVGFLDYKQIRTPLTKLTDEEIKYCINDVLVVSAYIQEQIEMYKGITKIPLTNTGRVRNYCRQNCFNGFSKDKEEKKKTQLEYKRLMSCLTLTVDEYKLLKRAFMGGFTHANAYHVGETLHNVSSFDFTSSYPWVMLSEQYPMGKGFQITINGLDEYKRLCEKYCLVFDMKLVGVKPKLFADNPISSSKCFKLENPTINNGRVVYADELWTTGTNIDLDIYMKFYRIEHVSIYNVYAYVKGYLPKNFLLSILQLYNDKTQLKGVQGKEVEYLHSKGMLNSCYGMTVTDIAKDENEYVEQWDKTPVDLETAIDNYNKSKNRFLFYPWGIFVTAYARRNLFSAIMECKNDYCYSDTDSVKILNKDKHLQYFNTYNEMVKLKIQKCCSVNGIDVDLFSPKTIKGKVKTIGVWDYEGDYSWFKTLGAKRYIYVQDEDLHVTIAGVGKQKTKEYLLSKFKTFENIFQHFQNGLTIPEQYTGKLTHTYIDEEMEGDIIDIDGNEYHYHELSGIHLSETTFEMSMTTMFLNFLRGITYEYRL